MKYACHSNIVFWFRFCLVEWRHIPHFFKRTLQFIQTNLAMQTWMPQVVLVKILALVSPPAVVNSNMAFWFHVFVFLSDNKMSISSNMLYKFFNGDLDDEGCSCECTGKHFSFHMYSPRNMPRSCHFAATVEITYTCNCHFVMCWASKIYKQFWKTRPPS